MSAPTFDSENNLVIDFDDLLDSMSDEAKVRCALLLANQTPVMLNVAQLLADGITYDSMGRYYYPANDEMHEARLYLLENFEEVQRLTTEHAINDRDAAVAEAREWESTARYLAGGTVWAGSESESAYYNRLHDAKEKARAWEVEHDGRRIR